MHRFFHFPQHIVHMVILAALVLFLATDNALALNDSPITSGKKSSQLLAAKNKIAKPDSDGSDQSDFEFSEDNLMSLEEEESQHSTHLYWQKFKQDFNSILTLDYGYAYQFGEPERTVLNRSSMRLELGRLFSNRYYAKIDGKITAYGADDHFSRADDESFHIESTLREAYLESNFNKITFKVGKQILIWGESDTAVVTDLISPRDATELNFKSLEDSRNGQIMLALNVYDDSGSWNLFINPDPGTDDLPDPETEYFVTMPLPADVAGFTEDKPDMEDTEFGLRWKRTFGQSDIALMAADLNENNPVLSLEDITNTEEKRLEKKYNRFRMIGFAGNFSWKNFIWKAETAYAWDRSYQGNDPRTGYTVAKRDTFDAAIGFDFASSSRLWNITMEIANKHIFSWENDLVNNYRNEPAVTAILSRDLLNDTLNFEYTFLAQLRSRDVFQKLKTEYELTDYITGILEVGGFTSGDQDGPYRPYRNKERIFIGLKLQI